VARSRTNFTLVPTAPQPQAEPSTRDNPDARQVESGSAENVEITDSKAAKKAALAQLRAETEQAIQQGQERGFLSASMLAMGSLAQAAEVIEIGLQRDYLKSRPLYVLGNQN
jgi:hypothetical protein